jgi:hypothetical protein
MTTTTAQNQVTTVLTVCKIASGRTEPGATNWQVHSDGVYVDVDTSAAGFATTPIYVTSLVGDGNHRGTTGASSVYSATATGFRVCIRWEKDYKTTDITPQEANGYKWHINWIAIEPFSQQGQGTSTQPSSTTTLIYGKTYHIQNGYANWGGGYLDTCGNATGNKYDVSTANTPTRAQGTGTWKIVSASGKQNGTPVLVGDVIYLQNQYQGDGGYLDTCNHDTTGNKYDVSTANTPTRAQGTGTWKIISSGNQNGTPVLLNDVIYLQNQYQGDGGYLDVRGNATTGNKYAVSTSNTQERHQGSTHWRFIDL